MNRLMGSRGTPRTGAQTAGVLIGADAAAVAVAMQGDIGLVDEWVAIFIACYIVGPLATGKDGHNARMAFARHRAGFPPPAAATPVRQSMRA